MSIELKNLFKTFLDELRKEGTTGQKALKILGYFLNLNLLEPQIKEDSFFEDFIFDLRYLSTSIEEDENEIKKIKANCIFSNLKNIRTSELKKEMENIWMEVLSKHLKTKTFFPENKSFGIKKDLTFKKIIDEFNRFNFDAIDTDILGEAYEEVIQDLMTGKVLGQFFTPTAIKKMMIDLINPQLKEDGTCESIYDPAMGTGGFLISSIRHLIKQSRETGTAINWSEVSKGLIGGREFDDDTFEFANSNMLISSGHLMKLENGDSIRTSIKNKYDIILANPPFGIKGLNFKEIHLPNKDEVLPIETSNAVTLFLQVIISILKVNGRCAIVLPDGKDLNSKTENSLVLIRQFLMKTCDLKEVIQLQSGVFTFTNIKTCVLYFEKKKEGNDVFDVEYRKATKRSKNETRYFTFKDTKHQTHETIFYEYNHLTEEKKEIVKVPIEKIIENKYSLNYKDYIEKEIIEVDNSIEWKKLGEVCDIDNGTRIVKASSERGEYPVYGGGDESFTTNSFNREGFNIVIGRFALSEKCVRLINKKIYLNDSGLTIKPKLECILHKYLGYYLYINQHIIYELARGSAQKNLDIDSFSVLEIPIPSLQRQNEIVEYLDFLFEDIKIKQIRSLKSQKSQVKKLTIL